MELSEGIKARRAVRRFTQQEIPASLLAQAMELAGWTPVIGFLRRWTWQQFSGESLKQLIDLMSRNTIHLQDIFLVEMDDEQETRARSFYENLGGAPIVLIQTIPIASRSDWERKYWTLCAGIAMQNLSLALHAVGLSSCGITFAPMTETALADNFDFPDQEVLAGLAIGFAAEEPSAPPKPPEPVLPR